MKLKNHVFEKDEIIVGGNLSALIRGALSNLPLVFTSPTPPDRFKKIPNSPKTQLELWERLMFFMGLRGLIPFSNLCQSIRVIDDRLDIITNRHRKSSVKFNNLIIYDDRQITGLPTFVKEEKHKNFVIDWVNVRSGCTHELDELCSHDNFVSKVHFYPTERSDNKNFKDLAAISYLTDEQLEDFDFSDTMVKFKVQKMMKEAGIRGARNGKDVNDPTKYKYYAIKVEPAQREIFEISKRYYEPADWFEMRYETAEDMLESQEAIETIIDIVGDFR